MVGAEFAWYHAVAIVRQLVDQLIPQADEGRGGSIPDIVSLSLHANGLLRAEVKPGDSTPPVVALGSLLHHLLANRDQPAVLRLLVLQAGAAAPAISLSELVYQLGQWERPNRRELLTAVYGMLSHTPPTHPGVDSPSAMRVVSPAENVHAAQPPPPGRKRFALRFLAGLAVGGGLILVAVLLFGGIRGVSGSASATASGGEPVLLSRPVAFVGAALTAALRAGSDLIGRGEEIGPSSPGADAGDAELVPTPPSQAENRPARRERANVSPRPPATSGPPRPPATAEPPRPPATATQPRSTRMVSADSEFHRARTLFENHRYAEAVAGFDRVLQTIDDAAAGGSELRWMTNEFLTLGRALAKQEAAVAARVYTAADGDVVQPVPLGRFLPPPPSDAGADRQCAVEILIDATGSVESAKLVGSRIGARDYWWVTVAKAWHFQPATKDGRPVKFLMSIPIPDESGLPQ
jgi:hypothetical protein